MPVPDTSPRRTRFTHAHRQRLERVIRHYLKDCYRRSTAARVSECAAVIGLAVPYLSRIAPEILGMPLRDYLRKRQVAYAAQLLRTTPLPAEEIAIRAAFGSVPTFYRWFKDIHGMGPGAYRRL
ncbi:MAG TPA: helix-turn-helix domain-containing protein [Thermoanaerobaculia bacterium]|nr:helix-turn-helix domain-containing protein [Thermoanaerobaculia bacterium]